MAEHGRLDADSAKAAATKSSGRRTVDATDLSRLIVDLLGEQIRYGLELAAALGQMAAWESIVRTQGEFFRTNLAWWRRSNAETVAGPDQGRPRSPRPWEHPVLAVMKHRCAVVAQPNETVQAAVARMAEEICGSVLFCDGDRLYGLFTESDLVTRVVGRGLDPRRTRLAEVMTRDPEWIGSTETVCAVLRRMDGFSHHPLPVVEDGRALGVISLRDLPLGALEAMLPELEQRRVLAERMR